MAYDDMDLLDEEPQPGNDINEKLKRFSIAFGKRLDSLPPRVPSPRNAAVQPPDMVPTFGSPGDQPAAGRPSLLSGVRRPARPDVMPTREDFPTKPLPTWKKVAGIAAAPFLPDLTQNLLGGPQREANRQYQGAVEDWKNQQDAEVRQAQLENIRSEIKSRDAKPAREVKPEIEVFNDLLKQGKTPQQASEIMKQAGQKAPTPSFEEQTYNEWINSPGRHAYAI